MSVAYKAIAVTGGIGSGKSLIASILERRGVRVVDADNLTKDCLLTQDIVDKIQRHFGDDFINKNGVNKKKLSEEVFSNNEKRKMLESIIHPCVFRLWEEIYNKYKNQTTGIAYIAPLLYETNRYRDFSFVIVVDIPEQLQVKRLLKAKKLSEYEIHLRIAAQVNRVERNKIADLYVDNSDSKEKTATFLNSQFDMIMDKVNTS